MVSKASDPVACFLILFQTLRKRESRKCSGVREIEEKGERERERER